MQGSLELKKLTSSEGFQPMATECTDECPSLLSSEVDSKWQRGASPQDELQLPTAVTNL